MWIRWWGLVVFFPHHLGKIKFSWWKNVCQAVFHRIIIIDVCSKKGQWFPMFFFVLFFIWIDFPHERSKNGLWQLNGFPLDCRTNYSIVCFINIVGLMLKFKMWLNPFRIKASNKRFQMLLPSIYLFSDKKEKLNENEQFSTIELMKFSHFLYCVL